MFRWKSLPQIENELRAYNYKPYFKTSDEEIITSEVCPACNIRLKYIGYKNIHTYRAFMYCGTCRYWEEY